MYMDWIWGFIGGLLIGTGGAVFLLFNGRIMGASGLIGGLVDGSGRGNWTERAVFLLGTTLVSFVLFTTVSPSPTNATDNIVLLVAGGLLVGLGTRMANGCTSGHGVCGISRLSPRGIVSTIFYIGAGAAMMGVFRHTLGVI